MRRYNGSLRGAECVSLCVVLLVKHTLWDYVEPPIMHHTGCLGQTVL